jgi:LuxR family transcriptional regulator, maltose regulon positive regulatory protein
MTTTQPITPDQARRASARGREESRQPPAWFTRSLLPGPGDVLRAGESRVPRLPGGYVPRPQLWERLDSLTNRSATLLIAPAGAGKTMGVAGWVRERAFATTRTRIVNHCALWVQADASWSREKLLHLLDFACGGSAAAVEASLSDRSVNGSHRRQRDLNGAAADMPSLESDTADQLPQLIVLDDAHLLPPSSLELIDRRLSDAPETMRVLLLSRWDLPLSRLTPELLGNFATIRGEILRLDEGETASLVETHAGTRSPEVAVTIGTRAQGWCAAVVLMARAVASCSDPVAAARRYSLTDTVVGTEVATEVFSALTPRERHLLLCVAADEEFSVDAAAHLSRDPRAAELLAELEKTGLLLAQFNGRRVIGTDLDATIQATEGGQMYRLHPLLADALRRRLVGGGVEVAQARATVVRAVNLDLARGEISHAFDRLVALGAAYEAAAFLADCGAEMVMRDGGSAVASFVRHQPDVINARPGTWFPIALQRWLAGDTDSAGYWLERVLTARRSDPEVACARLMRSRLGHEPMKDAVEFAQKQVVSAREQHAASPVDVTAHALTAAWLLMELGSTQNWLGDLAEAEVNLTAAAGLARHRAPGLAAEATSHLAMTQYMLGRERACVELATEALAILNEALPWRPRFTGTRATLAILLSGLVDVPWPTEEIEPVPLVGSSVHPADLTCRFWMHVRDARLALVGGAATDGERILTAPLGLPITSALPGHLRVAVLIDRAVIATLTGNQRILPVLESELKTLGAGGEASLVAGLRADLAGDRRLAIGLFSAAAETATYPQPAARGLALACEAQLLDALGDEDAALKRLRQAGIEMESRRNAAPFLGWSRHGTPIRNMLARLLGSLSTPWIRDVVDASQGHPDVVAAFAIRNATPQERAAAPDVMVRPLLSAREREVLTELARGSTYAGISANLFVSENTVKTHVSNLYGKLGASCRSEALAAARSMGLI